jgi:hypothetical protein
MKKNLQIILLLFLSLPLIINAQCLSGNYTIGGNNPDFPGYPEAIQALKKNGVCGPVTFNFRNGTYEGAFSISSITGASLLNTIRFKSENNDSSLVIIKGNKNAPDDIVFIPGAKFLIFSKLTFSPFATSSTPRCFAMYGGCENITITNCSFKIGLTSNESATIEMSNASSYKPNKNIAISNNTFYQSKYVVRSMGYVTDTNIVIQNNSFQNYGTGGVFISNTYNSNINKNQFYTPAANYGIFIEKQKGKIRIEKNMVSGGQGGISVSQCRGISTEPGQISNNMVNISSFSGFEVLSSSYFNIYHNSINNSSETPTSYAIRFISDTTIISKNNIYSHFGQGFSLLSDNTVIGYRAEKNNYYTKGSKLAYWKGDQLTLVDLVNASKADSNSVSVDPLYIGKKDLHIVSNVRLNGTGAPGTGITTDIDGDLRNQPPDIGADEYVLVHHPQDAGVVLLTTTSPGCGDSTSIYAIIENFSTDTLKNAILKLSLGNSLPITYNWSGSLVQGTISLPIKLGTHFIRHVADSIKVWTEMPNGGLDSDLSNDTNKIEIKGISLKGTFTIGASGSDFKTFKQATTYLSNHDICGPVVFKVKDGVYNESVLIPKIIPGSSAINTITFESLSNDSSKVTIKVTDTVALAINSKCIIIKKIGFWNRSTRADIPTLLFQYVLENCTISNCYFKSLDSTAIAIKCRQQFKGRGLKILNNYFTTETPTNGFMAISIFDEQSFSDTIKNIIVSNNVIKNFRSGMFINRADSVSVVKNKITTSNKNNNTYPLYTFAISITDAGTNQEISGNDISGPFNYGIRFLRMKNNLFSKRYVTNNFINIEGTGLFLIDAYNVQLYFNTININATPDFYVMELQGVDNLIVKNNILNTTGSNKLMLLSVINNNKNIFDYNDYYSLNSMPFSINGKGYKSIKNIQLATGQDYHSIALKPQFISATDLHLQNDINLNNRGVSISNVTTDFDGEVRGQFPDIGADESTATPLDNDAAITDIRFNSFFCDKSPTTVLATVRNTGSKVLNNVVIHFYVDATLQPAYNWTGNLMPDSTTEVTIGSVTANVLQSVKLKGYSSLPNGMADLNPLNDSISIDELVPAMNGKYSIGIGGDFSKISDALNSLYKNGVCAPVVFSIKKGTYNERLFLKSIKGVSAINTITVESESKNYGDVIITNADTTLKISGTDYLTFKNLTFKTNAAANLINFDGNSENIRFDSVHFYGSKLYAVKSPMYNLSFNKCFIESIVNFGFLYTPSKGLFITNCIFKTNDALTINLMDSVFIHNNRFINDLAQSAVTSAIRMSVCNGAKITNNYIQGEYQNNILLNSITGSSTTPVLIANNSISGGSTTKIHFSCTNSSYVDIFYNSISADKLATGALIIVSGGTNVRLKNNISSTSGNAYSLQVSLPSLSYSDYNIFYTANTNQVYYNNAATTFENYKTASGKDVNSKLINPAYYSATDLHYSNTLINGLAIPVAEVTHDIQNKLRDLTHPNPGAFETKADSVFDAINKDLSVKFTDTLVLGGNTITLSFKNNQILNIDPNHYYTGTIDTVDLSYQLDSGAVIKERWIGKLALDQTASYTFNTTLTVPRGKVYVLHVTATLYSSVAKDNNTANDKFDGESHIKMSGIYFVGGIHPDFWNGETAMASLIACHESAPVTFSFRNGHYTLLNPTGNDTLLVTSETGNNANVEIDVNSLIVSNLTIKKVTLNTIFPNGNGVQIKGSAITIDSCIVQGVPNGSSGMTCGFAISEASNVQLTHNHLRNLSSGIAYGVTFQVVSYRNRHEIAYNVFENVGTGFGIHANFNMDKADYINVHHNQFKKNNSGISISGTTVTTNTNIKIYNNEIINATYHALLIDPISSSTPIHLFNNFFSGGQRKTVTYTGKKGKWKDDYFETVILLGSKGIEFTNNSIYGAISIGNNTDCTFKNNSVFGDTLLAIYSENLNDFKGDYNNFYSNGKALIYLSRPSTALVSVIKHLDSLKILTPLYNQHSISYNPYYTSLSDLHSNSLFLKNKAVPDTMITTDFDGQPRSATLPDIGADEIDLIADVVWPGDANGDSKVDNHDLLSIGLYNGSTGIARQITSTSWAPYASMNWSQTQYQGANFKHADCNGDGKIDDSDTLAILQNFLKIHNTNHKEEEWHQENSLGYDLYFRIPNPKTTYIIGETIYAEIWFGTAKAPVTNFYGMAFNVSTYSASIQPGSFKIRILDNWAGANQTILRMRGIRELEGTAYAAFVRKDHISTNGYGKIGEISFIYNGNTPPDGIPINFGNEVVVDEKGNELQINAHNNNVNAYVDIATAIETFKNESTVLSSWPNPVSETSMINYWLTEESFVTLKIYNDLGQSIATLVGQTQAAGSHQVLLNAKSLGLNHGIYFITLNIDNELQTLKISVGN